MKDYVEGFIEILNNGIGISNVCYADGQVSFAVEDHPDVWVEEDFDEFDLQDHFIQEWSNELEKTVYFVDVSHWVMDDLINDMLLA